LIDTITCDLFEVFFFLNIYRFSLINIFFTSIYLTSSEQKKKKLLFFFYVFFYSIESNDDDISKMVTDELIRLQTNLNSIDNEVNNDNWFYSLDLFIINHRF